MLSEFGFCHASPYFGARAEPSDGGKNIDSPGGRLKSEVSAPKFSTQSLVRAYGLGITAFTRFEYLLSTPPPLTALVT